MLTRSLAPSLFACILTVGSVACTSSSSNGNANGGNHGGGNGADGGGGATAAPASRFFLPTGEPDNTSAPTVEVDAAGGIHSIYPAYAGGGAYYAYCPANCPNEDAVKVVRLDTDGTVANAMLALDADGHPHVLLSAYANVYYASCTGDCTEAAGWTTSSIVAHGGDREVSGEAFALDAQGHPRFLMHTYVAYLGIGQKAPETYWVACDAGCEAPKGWTASKIADQIWQSTTLRFDGTGRAHVATVAHVVEEGKATAIVGAYQSCDGDCTKESAWTGITLAPAFASEIEAVAMKPAIAMALTQAGGPRIVFLAADDANARKLVYAACDADCATENAWAAALISDGDDIGPGLDIALDAKDRPRFTYTFDYNIALAYCDDTTACADPEKQAWNVVKVEAGGDMKPDEIFLYENCNVGAWFLHSPSIALTRDGLPRVGYQARDISAGSTSHGTCPAGTDMTWSRMAVLSGL